MTKKKKTIRALGTTGTSTSSRTASTSQKALAARQSLRAAIDRCCVARGEAQWTNGYRAGARAGNDESLYAKERAQWAHVSAVEKRLERFITAYATAIRKGYVR